MGVQKEWEVGENRFIGVGINVKEKVWKVREQVREARDF